MCHSIMIISLYQSYYSLYLFDFILVLGGSDSFLFVEISQKDELILYLSFQMNKLQAHDMTQTPCPNPHLR